MPVLLRGLDQIMHERQRDTYFLVFERPLNSAKTVKARQDHLLWFQAKGLRLEMSAPNGWIEGDPGIYAVYFEGNDDPCVAAYSVEFEDESGCSLEPSSYQLYLIPYKSWIENEGQRYLQTINHGADHG